MDLTSGMRMNSDPQGRFKSDWIRGTPIILLMLYTDAAGNGSGFRLLSGAKHERVWVNWDIDERSGEVWVHKHDSYGCPAGAADTTPKRMIYDYLDRDVRDRLRNRHVTFQSDPGGTVTADYSYYLADTSPVATFLASDDDFVDYQDTPVYILPEGASTLDAPMRNKIWERAGDGCGRITTKIQWDKDRGILEFDSLTDVPAGRRIVAEYYHHTYKRLTNDGYDDVNTHNNGDLTFNHPIIVADTTTKYPDYTFADIKIVNEGEATLEDAKLTFVPRGYDVDGQNGVVLDPAAAGGRPIVDQVLDINRPWDIQRGTKDETYDRMACAVNSAFIWGRSCPKTDASSDIGATGILNSWRNKSFGDLPARGRVFGRVVWVLGPPYPQNTSPGVEALLAGDRRQILHRPGVREGAACQRHDPTLSCGSGRGRPRPVVSPSLSTSRIRMSSGTCRPASRRRAIPCASPAPSRMAGRMRPAAN